MLVHKFVGHPPRDARRGDVQLIRKTLQLVIGERDGLRAEGIGLDNVRAGFEIGAVYFGYNVRARQVEQVVVALLVLRPVFEAIASIGGFVQLVPLQRRSHRAVNDDDALAK
jgi:hypothetical protein